MAVAAAAARATGRLLAVRINAADPPWAHQDVITVIERAGAAVRTIVLPKVSGPEQVDLARSDARAAGAGAL